MSYQTFIDLDKVRANSLLSTSNDFSFINNFSIDVDFINSQINNVFKNNPINSSLFKLNENITTLYPKTLINLNSQINSENQEVIEKKITNIIDGLNKINQTLNITYQQINNTKTFLNILNFSQLSIDNIRKILSLSLSVIPSPPGAPGFLITVIDSLKTTINDLLKPRIKEITGVVDNLILYLKYLLRKFSLIITQTNNIINETQNIFTTLNISNIDLLNNINENLNSKQNTLLLNDESYKDFLIKISTKQFNSKVKQRKAVALNQFNIVVFETDYSFTTNNQLLIDELKIIIDKNTTPL